MEFVAYHKQIVTFQKAGRNMEDEDKDKCETGPFQRRQWQEAIFTLLA